MTEHEKNLRDAFRTMNADHAQKIRESYYKAIEGLQSLADMFEIADVEMPGPTNKLLIGEHFLACEAITTMRKSHLGRVL